MSDLQMALIALGVLIIASVVIYNWMQERKMRKNISEEFIVPQKDVLAEDFYIDADAYVDKALADTPIKAKLTEKLNKIDPVLAPKSELPLASEPIIRDIPSEDVSESVQAEMPVVAQVESRETVTHSPIEKTIPVAAKVGASSQVEEQDPDVGSPLPSDLHPQIDLTAFLFSTRDITTQTIITMAEAISSEMGVPMMLHGLDRDGKWHTIKSGPNEGSYRQFACSMQLADRSGPVAKQRLNKFQFAVENMGLELGAHVEWQGSGDAMQRAIDLDKFCMEVDQLVSVHLQQGDAPVHGTKFRGLAEASGMKLNDDGKFYFYTATHPDSPQFVLINADRQPFTTEGLRNNIIKGATFQIEIPKVGNCDQVFSQMIQIAQKMANSLGARMVDDNQKPLGDLQIEKIRQQLKVIHATMLARGVMPGSPSSERLFN